ncbi:hypothetical protein NB640_12385 [Oxalobacter vibrioformis]|uniref:Capsid assembly protein n=1 Tax=Oxalobacter vibrioformis TaxID=933080 RepID=A0A9E9M016_9BURK|nr:hypothetical protein [Oxalobacter vibrioformis]WAW09998.1 hypothetical protein NB640_12385 [Oxalobacter vibrioformis]
MTDMTTLPSDSPTTQKAAEPVPGSDEYNAMMAAKGEGGIEGETPQDTPEGSSNGEATQRPEDVPEKFWDPETGSVKVDEVLKSYKALEKEYTQSKQEKAKEPAEQSKEGEQGESKEGSTLDLDAFHDEYAETGELSEASYAKLSKAGLPPEVVNAYIAGQQALVDSRTQEGYTLAGGEEAFNKMATWAASAFTPAQLQAFNRAVNTSREDMEIAVMGLKAQYEKANGKAPNLMSGGTSRPSSVGYASHAEMTRDINDPRYSSDPAFRKLVEAKVSRTTSF